MKGIIFNVISSGLHIYSSQPRTYFNENAVFYMILGMISKICITLIVFIDINPNLNLLNLTYWLYFYKYFFFIFSIYINLHEEYNQFNVSQNRLLQKYMIITNEKKGFKHIT